MFCDSLLIFGCSRTALITSEATAPITMTPIVRATSSSTSVKPPSPRCLAQPRDHRRRTTLKARFSGRAAGVPTALTALTANTCRPSCCFLSLIGERAALPRLLVDAAEVAGAGLPGQIGETEDGPPQPGLERGAEGDLQLRHDVLDPALAAAGGGAFPAFAAGSPGSAGGSPATRGGPPSSGTATGAFFHRRWWVFLLVGDRRRAGRDHAFGFGGRPVAGGRAGGDRGAHRQTRGSRAGPRSPAQPVRPSNPRSCRP